MITRNESLWGYVASIVHLVFASATSVTALSVVFSGTKLGTDFSPLLAIVLSITIFASFSMAFVVTLLALKWSNSVFFRAASAFYVIVAIITFYSTLTPIAAFLHPDSFGGPDSATNMAMLGIHELEYYFIAAMWVAALIWTDGSNDLPRYAKIVGYLSVLNVLCMIGATLIAGHGMVYDINILLLFILYPIFVTGLVIMMRRLHRNSMPG